MVEVTIIVSVGKDQDNQKTFSFEVSKEGFWAKDAIDTLARAYQEAEALLKAGL